MCLHHVFLISIFQLYSLLLKKKKKIRNSFGRGFWKSAFSWKKKIGRTFKSVIALRNWSLIFPRKGIHFAILSLIIAGKVSRKGNFRTKTFTYCSCTSNWVVWYRWDWIQWFCCRCRSNVVWICLWLWWFSCRDERMLLSWILPWRFFKYAGGKGVSKEE